MIKHSLETKVKAFVFTVLYSDYNKNKIFTTFIDNNIFQTTIIVIENMGIF